MEVNTSAFVTTFKTRSLVGEDGQLRLPRCYERRFAIQLRSKHWLARQQRAHARLRKRR